MSVDRTEVERIAALARLHLRNDELERLTRDMNAILDHATRLREVGDVEDGGAGGGGHDGGPGAHSSTNGGDAAIVGLSGTRADGAETPDPLRSPIREWAPETASGFFLVPPPPGVTAEGEDLDEGALDGKGRA